MLHEPREKRRLCGNVADDYHCLLKCWCWKDWDLNGRSVSLGKTPLQPWNHWYLRDSFSSSKMASEFGAKFGKNLCNVYLMSIPLNSTTITYSFFFEAQLKFLYDFLHLCIRKEGLLPEEVLTSSHETDNEAGKCLFKEKSSGKGKINHIQGSVYSAKKNPYT